MKKVDFIFFANQLCVVSIEKDTDKAVFVRWKSSNRKGTSNSYYYTYHSAWIPKSIFFNEKNIYVINNDSVRTQYESCIKEELNNILAVEEKHKESVALVTKTLTKLGKEVPAVFEMLDSDIEKIQFYKEKIEQAKMIIEENSDKVVFRIPSWFNCDYKTEVEKKHNDSRRF